MTATHDRRRKRIEQTGERITQHTLIDDTPRKLHHALRLVLKEQLDLFYGPQIQELKFTDKKRATDRLEEFHVDLGQLLSNLNNYIGQLVREHKAQQRNPLLVRQCLQQLELDPEAVYTRTDVRDQYRALAQKVHPDHNGNSEHLEESTARMQDLNEAYTYLKENL
jgi:hypothetical protein